MGKMSAKPSSPSSSDAEINSKASPPYERGPADQSSTPHSDSKPEKHVDSHSPKAHNGRQDAEEDSEDPEDLESGQDETSPPAAEEEAPSDEEAPPLPEGEEPPPLPIGEAPPPLPDKAPPNDGWEAMWDNSHQAYYFYNHLTGATQWENPRVPEADADGAGSDGEPAAAAAASASVPKQLHGGYNPAIHGDYDPDADYAKAARAEVEAQAAAEDAQLAALRAAAGIGVAPEGQAADYGTTGAFNRFTGKWQAAEQTPDRHNDESKSRRQMNAYFDVDAAANSHGGRSLKAERQNKKLSKAELKAFKDKRRERKEEKRRAWLRD